MYRRTLSLLALLIWALSSFAQNLVPNPSFETYTGCPGGNSAISNGFVPSWNRPPGSIITPDLFTNCTSSGLNCTDFNTANNCVGSSTPWHATAYAGFLWYYTACPNCKEYIQATLTSPCVSGTVYRASYRAKLGNLCRYGTNRLGLYLSATAPSQPGGNQPIIVTPTVERAGQVLDKVNWTLVSGTFTSNGTEQIITIGNFYNDASTSIFNFGSSAGSCLFATSGAYYMIDSVIVRPAVILPVRVLSFQGSTVGDGNRLEWQLEPGVALSELWLEHSRDGEHFSPIGSWRQPGAAQLATDLLHEAPPAGLNYYRLGMADRNGEFMVSEVVALKNEAPLHIRLDIQPNPATSEAMLSFDLPEGATAYTVTAVSMSGALVLDQQVQTTTPLVQHILPTADWAAGVYLVQVRSGALAGLRRLVVNH